MKPITFPEQNRTWVDPDPVHGTPPGYLPLPAYSNARETISLWALTWRERLRILWTGRLWLRQCNAGAPLQAQAPTTETPFVRAEGETP